MKCLFCKIASGEISSEIIHEDKSIKVFKDIQPKAPVHLLVIPKIHIQSIAHLEADHNDVIAKLIYAAKRVAEERGLRGYKLVFNVGREGGQVIDHLHLHLLGGWSNTDDRKTDV
jgi:histidine triad (HIT) family protein